MQCLLKNLILAFLSAEFFRGPKA